MSLNDQIQAWLATQGVASTDYRTGHVDGEPDGILYWGPSLPLQPTAEAMATAYAAQQSRRALLDEVQAAMVAGVPIVCTSTPSLSGTYAIDPQSISDIQAETVFLMVNGGQFTAGTSLQWPDTSGALHTFTSSLQFQAWASAVARYVSALRQVVNGIPGASIPATPVTIP